VANDVPFMRSEKLDMQKATQGMTPRLLTQATADFAVVSADDPLRLAVAAKIAFPDGSMTASGLRREAARGRLQIERIANKDFVTLAEIQRMRELCRVQAKELGCSSVSRDSVVESSSPKLSGLSRTVPSISPQDALRTRLKQSRHQQPNKP
jgi:hypothetical protein